MIRDEKYLPGQKILSEREMCERFEVSRTSVREGIEGLCSTGILEKRSDGTYISNNFESILHRPFNLFININDISLEEVHEARVAIEVQNARLAARKATPEDLAKIKNILDKTESSDDHNERHALSALFHKAIAEATHNQILIASFSMIYEAIYQKTKHANTKASKGHKDVYEAIASGDPIKAAQVMEAHLMQVEKNIKMI